MLDLFDFLPYQLATLSSEVSQALARSYGRSHGLAIPEWRVMAIVGQFERLTARSVCDIGRMHKTTVSRAIGGLLERTLVDRETNPADMREMFLVLTPEGRQIYEQIVPVARSIADEIGSVLTRDERVQLQRLLRKLSERSAKVLAA